MSSPLFSILHTSARPGKWREIYDAWMQATVNPADVEYVLCIDPRWGFLLIPELYEVPLDNLLVVQNTGRRCYVDGVNIAAKASSGRILIVNADDQYPCEGWDSKISGFIRAAYPSIEAWAVAHESVIEVSTGTPDEHARGIMVMPILSRARYEKLGYVFYPAYESMFADNDFCEHARQDGIVIDARHLMFPHRHPINGQAETDAAYEAQNRPEAFRIGKRILDQRRASGFATLPPAKRAIGVCFTGERFEGAWLDGFLALYDHLSALGFEVHRLRGYTSNVYETREGVRRAIMNAGADKPDLYLWLDDDNILTPAHFDQLLADIEAHPEVDGVLGWCWIHRADKTGFMVSCGEWAPDYLHWNPFPPSFANESGLRPVECGGLPVILMRLSALEKAGDGAFLPILDNRLDHGISGEDMCFFHRASEGGAKFLVDPQVRVPHLKYVEVCPVFPSEGSVPVKIACMMRVKNEARWIKRVIESVRQLCGADIYVMDDGSTDSTAEIAMDAGAVVLASPYAGLPLDECRDKTWLLAHVRSACSPDWILMPDGDEELEPGASEKIRRVLETNPPIDCFALRVLYLWDALDTARFDGSYATVARQSLFRASSCSLEFKSFYEGKSGQNHVGLHCSNAPGLGGMRQSPLNVFLLHYGYLHKEDRIRKYLWMLSIDPANQIEDFYRHMVQGDIPEVPADIQLKHAGPLLLRKIPNRLVPKFDVMPEPRPTVMEVAG